MQHATHMTAQTAEPAELHVGGEFGGHVLPGTLFLVWAAWWVARTWRDRAALRAVDATLEADVVAPAARILLALAGIAVELPPRDWPLMDAVGNLQHVTMYAFFALSGVVDLLARAGRVSRGATYLAFAAASVNAGVLFLAHGMHGGVPATVHALLGGLFVAAAIFAAGEWLRPELGLHWLRMGAVLLLGTWFWEIAFVLYRSSWDLMDPGNQMRAYLHFSWHVLAVTALLVTLRAALGRPPAAAGTLRPASGRSRPESSRDA